MRRSRGMLPRKPFCRPLKRARKYWTSKKPPGWKPGATDLAPASPALPEVLDSVGGVQPPISDSSYHSEVRGDKRVIHIDPEILGGTPVFVGTRVPVQAL